MASASVYYKFKSQKDFSRVNFDGTGISVWDLKREIILQNRMGRGTDFDLAVHNADTEEEYKDDNAVVPRSSQVIARRLPPSKPGRGSAAQYVADVQSGGANSNVTEDRGMPSQAQDARRAAIHRGQMTMRFDNRDGGGASSSTSAPSNGATAPSLSSGLEGDEASRIAAMFQATTEQWDETQEKMANATYRSRPGGPPRPPRPANSANQAGAPFHPPTHDRPPPIGYICFRCGQKGHWIYDCPTNDDREFDNKPRFKRTTGIPKSMLKTVEAPADGIHREGVMVTPDGSYVVAQVDSASWARNQAHRQKRLTRSDVYSSIPSNPKLACSLCNKLLRDAVRTPCCKTLFCEECITTHLLEHEFQCPECEKRVKDLVELQRDDDVRKQVREYVEAEMDQSEKKLQEAEQAAQDEIDKVRKEREEEERKAKVEAGILDPEPGVGNGDIAGADSTLQTEDGQTGAGVADAATDLNLQGSGPAWSAEAVQRIMMMLCNPALPPPMRMQLQMQLRFMHNQFVQSQHQQQQPSMQQNAGSLGNDGSAHNVFGAHNANPFAGQHLSSSLPGAPFFMSNGGMMGSMGMGMGMSFYNAQMANKFQPAAPLSHQESAYMRLPVNPNKRTVSGKRERPADFLELGGGAKEPRMA